MNKEKFYSKIEMSDSGCWEWQGCIDVHGYGRWGGKRAHRMIWEEFYGVIAAGMMICHHCDNRQCVNPEHLFEGTDKDNVQDMWQKGRGNTGRRWLPADTIVDILRMHAITNKRTEVAERFGVSSALVWYIWSGKGYKKLLAGLAEG